MAKNSNIWQKKDENLEKSTYTELDLIINGVDDFVDASPDIFVFGAPSNHIETFQDVYDVVNASTFDAQLTRAQVQVEETTLVSAVKN